MHDGIVRAGDMSPHTVTAIQRAVEDGVRIGRTAITFAVASMCTFIEECRIRGDEAKPPRYLSDYEVERLAVAAVSELLADRQYAELASCSHRESVITTGAMVWLLAAGRL